MRLNFLKSGFFYEGLYCVLQLFEKFISYWNSFMYKQVQSSVFFYGSMEAPSKAFLLFSCPLIG